MDELAADAVPGSGTTELARLDATSAAAAGAELELSLDTSQIKLFDPDGGRAL